MLEYLLNPPSDSGGLHKIEMGYYFHLFKSIELLKQDLAMKEPENDKLYEYKRRLDSTIADREKIRLELDGTIAMLNIERSASKIVVKENDEMLEKLRIISQKFQSIKTILKKPPLQNLRFRTSLTEAERQGQVTKQTEPTVPYLP